MSSKDQPRRNAIVSGLSESEQKILSSIQLKRDVMQSYVIPEQENVNVNIPKPTKEQATFLKNYTGGK